MPSYGDDIWTRRASDAIRAFFDSDCEVFFVFNGTAANSLALASLCQSYHSVICHNLSHIETDECGAPEFFSNGTKILLGSGENGKLHPADVAHLASRRTDIHYPKPKVLSLSQPTELGTVYSLDELAALRETAQQFGLRVQLDGARFFNAVAALGCSPKAVIEAAGADVLSLGGTKLGMTSGEAVVFFDRELAEDFAYRCKQSGQLASKMRFLAAQWVGVLETGEWESLAGHANSMALLLRNSLEGLGGIEFAAPTEANSVFISPDRALFAALRARGWGFYEFIGGAARFMCSWKTEEDDVRLLAQDIREVVS